MTTRKYTLWSTETAELDLAEIWSYIASEASEATATRFLSSITIRFDDLLTLPSLGVPRPQLARGLRVFFQGNYAVYYVLRADEIVIVRVLHGSRDTAAIADQAGFQV
jgi:toxin ParE1/3/4